MAETFYVYVLICNVCKFQQACGIILRKLGGDPSLNFLFPVNTFKNTLLYHKTSTIALYKYIYNRLK